jgi:hypothetical protein
MKSKMKIQRQTELPRFIVGALATAGASAASGATVQITINGSFISSSTGNHLDTDIGNDGVSDLSGEIANTNNGFGRVNVYAVGNMAGRAAQIGSNGYAKIGNDPFVFGAGVQVSRKLVAFTLYDANVRAGASTRVYLDLTATGGAVGEKGRVDVHRFIFDDATGGTIAGLNVNDAAFTEYVVPAVPEPSSLGLLALGAGGLLARRRRAMAA